MANLLTWFMLAGNAHGPLPMENDVPTILCV
jgi:hypothetical protein